jgi:hypothetical protein
MEGRVQFYGNLDKKEKLQVIMEFKERLQGMFSFFFF